MWLSRKVVLGLAGVVMKMMMAGEFLPGRTGLGLDPSDLLFDESSCL